MKAVPTVKPRRLDRRNPFKYWTRRYGFFSAFLAGGGSATREKLVDGAIKTRAACGIVEGNVEPIKKEIADHINVWKHAADKKGYLLTVTEQDGVLTVTHVGEQTWGEYMAGKVR